MRTTHGKTARSPEPRPSEMPRIAGWCGRITLITLLSVSLSCQPRALGDPDPGIEANSRIDGRTLRRALFDQGTMLLVYGTSLPDRPDLLREPAEQLAARSRNIKVIVRPDTAVSREDLRHQPLMLIGTPASNRVLSMLAGNLPYRMAAESATYAGQVFTDRSTTIVLNYYPSPFNQTLPLFVVAGFDDSAVAGIIGQAAGTSRYFPAWNRWGMDISENGRTVLLSEFDAARGWMPDTDRTFAFREPSRLLARSGPFRIYAEGGLRDGTEVQARLRRLEASLSEMEAFTGTEWSGTTLAIHLYPSLERKGMTRQSTRPADIDWERDRVDLVWDETWRRMELGGAQLLALRHLLGKASLPLLERGLALQFTRNWQHHGYDHWADILYRSDNLFPLADLLDASMLEHGYDLLFEAMAGSFVHFLLDTWPRDRFLAFYRNGAISPSEVDSLERAWHTWLNARSKPPQPSGKKPVLPYLKGFNFAQEGFSVYDGYGSRRAAASLEKMREMGSNATAIIPYSGMEDPNRPGPFSIMRRAGSENDEVVIHAGREAAKLGMRTLLKPQLWIRGGSWPGDVEMKTEADWQAFFRHYHTWMLHYALLAEIHGFDMLCVGTELSRTTLQRPDDWRALIRKVRGVFSGTITYAANWGEEFERLDFWQELDLMGLNCYYPLSKRDDPTPAELRRGFRRNLERVEKVVEGTGKPLVLTEIGFTSAARPWLNPHEDGRDRRNQPVHQRLCYEIAFEEISRNAWCKGIFWWKFPTDPSYAGREDSICFTPNLKPAEEVVRAWFPKLGGD